ncbi:MAG: lytic murein transglycosylase [Hyphomicrobium sp.]
MFTELLKIGPFNTTQLLSSLFLSIFVLSATFTPNLIHAEEQRLEFNLWVVSLWPQARAAGISRETFDRTLRDLRPNFKIPDLDLPDQKNDGARGQAEFTKPPGEYLNKSYLESLASQGRIFAQKYKNSLEMIEQEYGVDRSIILAIWGRETAFGKHKLPYDAIEVLATLAWTGRRKDFFQNELIEALKMIQSGIPRSEFKSSWAGAVGLTQFMPSEYFQFARDIDGDGKKDIFNSIPDALASAAAQLRGKGWIRNLPWGYEVSIPDKLDCSLEGPLQSRLISSWIKLDFKRADKREWSNSIINSEAYLMSPGGAYGPSFLVFENFKVLRRYNTSDLYAVFVGHLADRISGGGDFIRPFLNTATQRNKEIKEIQIMLKNSGYNVDKIDGKIGSNTRMLIGIYQSQKGLKVDCWPTKELFNQLQKTASK